MVAVPVPIAFVVKALPGFVWLPGGAEIERARGKIRAEGRLGRARKSSPGSETRESGACLESSKHQRTVLKFSDKRKFVLYVV
jgi:hypothetical protein